MAVEMLGYTGEDHHHYERFVSKWHTILPCSFLAVGIVFFFVGLIGILVPVVFVVSGVGALTSIISLSLFLVSACLEDGIIIDINIRADQLKVTCVRNCFLCCCKEPAWNSKLSDITKFRSVKAITDISDVDEFLIVPRDDENCVVLVSIKEARCLGRIFKSLNPKLKCNIDLDVVEEEDNNNDSNGNDIGGSSSSSSSSNSSGSSSNDTMRRTGVNNTMRSIGMNDTMRTTGLSNTTRPAGQNVMRTARRDTMRTTGERTTQRSHGVRIVPAHETDDLVITDDEWAMVRQVRMQRLTNTLPYPFPYPSTYPFGTQQFSFPLAHSPYPPAPPHYPPPGYLTPAPAGYPQAPQALSPYPQPWGYPQVPSYPPAPPQTTSSSQGQAEAPSQAQAPVVSVGPVTRNVEAVTYTSSQSLTFPYVNTPEQEGAVAGQSVRGRTRNAATVHVPALSDDIFDLEDEPFGPPQDYT